MNILGMILQVLIETYWNVKPCGELLCIHPRGVLIETYWNVKNHSDVDFRLYPDKY